MSRDNLLKKIWDKAQLEITKFSSKELINFLNSTEANQRLYGLVLIRKQIKDGDFSNSYLELAIKRIEDSDNNCRWQSIIIVGEFIEKMPEKVWDVILKYGNSQDEDMRNAIATILLEHLFEFDFNQYFAKLKNEIRNGNVQLIDTLKGCSTFGVSDYQKQIDNFILNIERGKNKVNAS